MAGRAATPAATTDTAEPTVAGQADTILAWYRDLIALGVRATAARLRESFLLKEHQAASLYCQ